MILLLTGAFNRSSEQLAELEQLGFEVHFARDERVDIKSQIGIDIASVQAVVCNGLFLHNDIGEFKSLKFIQLVSAGFDRIDMDYCKAHGIEVCNAKGVYSIPMAEWVVLRVLEIYKDTRFFAHNQNERRWEKKRDLPELHGKTATIVGFGDAGRETAKRLTPFGVHINAVDIHKIETDYNDESYLIDYLETPLSQSDIVILTLPLTDRTRHLFSDRLFDVIKRDCVLVNVSRGAVIDEQSLIRNIAKFRGVALDVFEQEPLHRDSPLWVAHNVIITPHNSFVSTGNNARMWSLTKANLQSFIGRRS